MIATPTLLAEASARLTVDATSIFTWVHGGTIIKVTDERLPDSPDTPAWCVSEIGEITISLAAIFPEDRIAEVARDIVDKKITVETKKVYGFLAHEASHNRWSTWNSAIDPAKVKTPAALNTMTLFEELRIEKRAADLGGAHFLRASFQWLLDTLADKPVDTRPVALAHTWALTHGRYTAGVASRDEVAEIDTIIRAALGDDTVDMLVEVLDEAVEYDHHSNRQTADTLTKLAHEWLSLLNEDDDEADGEGEGEGKAEGEGGGSVIFHDGDKPGGKPVPGLDTDEVGEKTEGAGGEAEDGDKSDKADGEHYDEIDSITDVPEYDPETAELIKAAAGTLAEAMEQPLKVTVASDMADPREQARKVFGGKDKRGGSHVWNVSKPTPENRTHATSLARTFERMALPSVQRTSVATDVPPGRLRGREAVRRSAERSRGMMTTATPWERTKRTRTTTRPIVVGTMTDTSGSMGWAQRLVAEFAWTVALAGNRVGARTAAVTFGSKVDMIAKPNEVPRNIYERAADGSTEKFDEAAAALDGVLHLSAHNGAAKVLFVISDGQLVIHGETARACERLKQFTNAGTMVVWLGMDGYLKEYYEQVCKPGSLVWVDMPDGYSPYSPRSADTRKIMETLEASLVKAARGMTSWEYGR